ncbi:MAG: Gx transporter family protein [Oscillospiraceae bacterium]|nr:Gx transporter family protein [Oscillospiraceae bacterium]
MKIPVKKLTLMAILTAVALIIFIIEAQIPLPVPVPGVKLGLANAVTLFALFYTSEAGGQVQGFTLTPKVKPCTCPPASLRFFYIKDNIKYFSIYNVLFILLCRIILGAVFTGRPIVVVYSLAGGMLAFIAMVVMKRFVSDKQIWVCGAIGAVFHNIGQILAAIIITGTPSIAAYLPILIITGVITGILTGLVAQFTLERLEKMPIVL